MNTVTREREDYALTALQSALKQRSPSAVMAVFKGLDETGLTQLLGRAGFEVDVGVTGRGRAAIFDAIKADLGEAVLLGVDGHSLRSSRSTPTFAAKALDPVEMSFGPVDFDGDFEAASVIQAILRSSRVKVDLMGEATATARTSLLMVAGQALMGGVQGFGFDGIAGKYEVPLSLHDMVDLHKSAAIAVAMESACTGVGQWATGRPLTPLHPWVPDTVQRLLYGPVTLDAAQAVVASIESRGFERHASDIGVHGITTILSSHGLDVSAPTIEQQAQELGLLIREPNRERGQHFGTVMGLDHRAGLVKVTRTDALELPFSVLPADQKKLGLGDSVHIAYKAGQLNVKVTERGSGEVGR
jgi:hypothetical protein